MLLWLYVCVSLSGNLEAAFVDIAKKLKTTFL